MMTRLSVISGASAQAGAQQRSRKARSAAVNPILPMTRRGAAAALLALTAAPSLARAAMQAYPVVGKVERLDPALDALVDADAVVEQVLDGFTWSEGPVWVGGKDGFLLVSDV